MGKGSPDYVKSVKLLGVDKYGKTQVVFLDEAGRIMSVMTGEDPSGSKILATDKDGRLIAVITDPENIWGIRPLVGNAELAVRLGSPHSWSRTGSVILMESFQYGLTNWFSETNGENGGIVLTSDYYRSKGYCAKIMTGTGTPPLTYLECMGRFGSYVGKVGLEFHISNLPSYGMVEVEFYLDNGTDRYVLDLKVDFSTKLIYYRDSRDEWHTTGETMNYYTSVFDWHTIKILGDTLTGKYISFLIDDQVIPLTDVVCAIRDTFGMSRTMLRFNLTGKTGEASVDCYLDDIIHTIYEE